MTNSYKNFFTKILVQDFVVQHLHPNLCLPQTFHKYPDAISRSQPSYLFQCSFATEHQRRRDDKISKDLTDHLKLKLTLFGGVENQDGEEHCV